jgi:hypothetical protein
MWSVDMTECMPRRSASREARVLLPGVRVRVVVVVVVGIVGGEW